MHDASTCSLDVRGFAAAVHYLPSRVVYAHIKRKKTYADKSSEQKPNWVKLAKVKNRDRKKNQQIDATSDVLSLRRPMLSTGGHATPPASRLPEVRMGGRQVAFKSPLPATFELVFDFQIKRLATCPSERGAARGAGALAGAAGAACWRGEAG